MKLKASYTIELILLLPVIFMVMFCPIKMDYDLYGEIKHSNQSGWEETLDPVKEIQTIRVKRALQGRE